MLKVRSNTVTYFAVCILVLGVVSTVVGVAVVRYRSNRNEEPAAVPFTMVSNQTFYTNDGKPMLQAVQKRVQRSDGSYKLFSTNYDANGSISAHNEMMGITGWGVFNVDHAQRSLIFRSAKRHRAHELDEDALRRGADGSVYKGEDRILGFRVLVERFSDSDNSYTDAYRAPGLNGLPLKEVIMNEDGSSTVIEAVKIDLGEPSESDFGEVPDYSVDYTVYERQIQAADARGEHELANQMRQVLKEQRALGPKR